MRRAAAAAGAVALLLAAGIRAEAAPERVRVTCYCPTGSVTATGCAPYEGILAGPREHFGDVAVLYSLDREYIGLYECRDTGGDDRIRRGTRLDVFRDDLGRAKEWVREHGDYLLVDWIEGEG